MGGAALGFLGFRWQGKQPSTRGSAPPPLHPQGLKDTVASVLEGYNATVLAYGQTVRTDWRAMEGGEASSKTQCPAPHLPTQPPPAPSHLPALCRTAGQRQDAHAAGRRVQPHGARRGATCGG